MSNELIRVIEPNKLEVNVEIIGAGPPGPKRRGSGKKVKKRKGLGRRQGPQGTRASGADRQIS